ncbi:hypothetical protein HDU79_007482 [Rhizoclosmatium sp. JEL0117]|nr:hypothetical protein HDU79_007482 [Rhizoclosmatium sp. JEL0117]
MVPSDRVQEMIQEARREVGCLSGKVKEGVAVWKAEVDRLYKEIDRLRAEKRQMIPSEEVHDMIEEARREREEELKLEQRALEVIPAAINPNPSDLELKYLSLTRRHESLEASHNSLKVGYEKELNAHKNHLQLPRPHHPDPDEISTGSTYKVSDLEAILDHPYMGILHIDEDDRHLVFAGDLEDSGLEDEISFGSCVG